MSYKAAIAAAFIAVASSPVTAQGITGGGLGVEYSLPIDGGDFGGTTYYGAIEYGLNRNISFGADLSGYRLDNISTDASSATLHGSYHLSETLSVGAFYGMDWIEDADRALYGVEAGTEFLGGNVEGYLGKLDGDGGDGTLLGVDGSYYLSNGFSVIGNVGILHADDAEVSRISIGGEYQLEGGPQFYAEIGNVETDTSVSSGSETFIGIGATVAFGAKRGTTFNQRSMYEILPGF